MRNSPPDKHTPSRPLGWFGKYLLEEEIGEGSTSIVFRARDTELERQVAIKMFKVPPVEEQAEFLEDFERFKEEGKIVAKFDHAHIIRILDAGVHNGIPFIVMPFASGGSLHKQYPLGTRLPLALVIRIVNQIAAGLQNAHDHRVVHCDVKPGNMFLDSDGKVLIGDFGIAKVQQKITDSDGYLVMGTPEYMAPEQINGHPIPASDQYALAAVVCQWLIGNYLFTGDLSRDVLSKQLYTEPPSLQQLNPLIPEEVEMVLRKALSKEANDRYATIQQFADALQEAGRTHQSQTTEPDTPSIPRSQITTKGTPRVKPLGRRQQRPSRRYGGLWLGIILSMLMLALLAIVYLFFTPLPHVTVMISLKSPKRVALYNFTPVPESSDTSINQIYERTIEATTPSQTYAAHATGRIVALKAQGILTFYNGKPVSQTIPAGTIVTTPNGMQFATDADTIIPAENLPDLGNASVSAHAVQPGSAGNIPTRYIVQHCCTTDNSIQVVNYDKFTGGQDAQPELVLQQSDLDNADTAAQSSLDRTVEALLNTKKHDNEVLAGKPFCTDTQKPDVPVGSKATTVSVQITRYCLAWVYDSTALVKLAEQQYRADTQMKPGDRYTLGKKIDVAVIKVDLPDPKQGITSLQVQISGVWNYSLSEKQKQTLLQNIRGKSNAEARRWLMSQSEIADASIQYNWPFSWLRHDTLPDQYGRFELRIGSAVKNSVFVREET